MKGCGGRGMRVFFLVMGAVVFWGSLFSGCNSSETRDVTLNGYAFHPESATLTNPYFPGRAGYVLAFVGHGSFEGSHYVWMFNEGEVVQGVATLRETGTVIAPNGETSVRFDSMLAQDIHGNVHVLKTDGMPSGVAAGPVPAILMPGHPKVGDRFAPGVNYTGTVLSLNETVDSYTGVLHTRFVADSAAENKKNQYDDYWAPGIGQVKTVWSLADGSEGYWVRSYPDFHVMQNDAQACMQPGPPGEDARMAFSTKYNVPLSKLEPLGAANAPFDWGTFLCAMELNVWLGGWPGAVVWRIRADMDHWDYQCGSVDSYCYKYRYYCDLWAWYPGCLEKKMGMCFKH